MELFASKFGPRLTCTSSTASECFSPQVAGKDFLVKTESPRAVSGES